MNLKIILGLFIIFVAFLIGIFNIDNSKYYSLYKDKVNINKCDDFIRNVYMQGEWENKERKLLALDKTISCYIKIQEFLNQSENKPPFFSLKLKKFYKRVKRGTKQSLLGHNIAREGIIKNDKSLEEEGFEISHKSEDDFVNAIYIINK